MNAIKRAARKALQNSALFRRAYASPAAQELALNYVAGETVAEAVAVARTLTKQGLSVGFTYQPLPEDEPGTAAVLVELLDELGELAEGADLSVKPSALGLRTDPAGAVDRLLSLADSATQRGATITLEMQYAEDYLPTVELFYSARREVPSLGVTLPVNYRRSEELVGSLADSDARVRVCVGSYPAPAAESYNDEHANSLALVRCLRLLMEGSAVPLLATHNPTVIDIAEEISEINANKPFEYQMFYGVRPLEHRRLVDTGHLCRTYIPFGSGWYDYLVARTLGRPRILAGYVRSLLDKR